MKTLVVVVGLMVSGMLQAYTCECSYTYYMNTFNTPISVSASTYCSNNERFMNECYANAGDFDLTAVCFDRETGRVDSATTTISGASVGGGHCSIR